MGRTLHVKSRAELAACRVLLALGIAATAFCAVLAGRPGALADWYEFIPLVVRLMLLAHAASLVVVAAAAIRALRQRHVFASFAVYALLFALGGMIYLREAAYRRSALAMYYYLHERSRLDGGKVGIVGASGLPAFELRPAFHALRIDPGDVDDILESPALPRTVVATRATMAGETGDKLRARGFREHRRLRLGGTRYLAYALGEGDADPSAAPPAAASERLPIRLAVLGDSGTGSIAVREISARIRAAHSRQPFDAAIFLGDNVYLNKLFDERTAFQRAIIEPFGWMFEAAIPAYAILGNHDFEEPRILRDQLDSPLLGMDGYPYYDVELAGGEATLFMLESEHIADDPLQRYWLAQRLKRCTSPWKILCVHRPPQVAPGQGRGSREVAEILRQARLRENGVQLVLSGHNHVYERYGPGDLPAMVVAGGSGEISESSNPLPPEPLRQAGYSGEEFYLELEIGNSAIRTTAVTRTGKAIDRFAITRDGKVGPQGLEP